MPALWATPPLDSGEQSTLRVPADMATGGGYLISPNSSNAEVVVSQPTVDNGWESCVRATSSEVVEVRSVVQCETDTSVGFATREAAIEVLGSKVTGTAETQCSPATEWHQRTLTNVVTPKPSSSRIATSSARFGLGSARGGALPRTANGWRRIRSCVAHPRCTIRKASLPSPRREVCPRVVSGAGLETVAAVALGGQSDIAAAAGHSGPVYSEAAALGEVAAVRPR